MVVAAGAGAVSAALVSWVGATATIAAKGWSEWHLHQESRTAGDFVLAANGNNNLARQGLSVPKLPGEAARAERDRVAGIRSGVSKKDGSSPGYLEKVPAKNMTGDLRKTYSVGSLGSATSTKGNIDDILAKVPNRGAYGATDDYRRANRKTPSRAGGFGNQSYPE